MLKRLSTLLLIRAHERSTLVYFCAIFFLIGAGLAIGRGTADALFFKRYGIEHLPTLYGVLSLVFAVVTLAYAAIADRLAAERLLQKLLLALIVMVGICAILIAYTDIELSYPLYLIVYEVASELLFLHGALYLNQNFEILQEKRLAPLVLGAAQVGIVCGGLFLAISADIIGINNLPVFWAILAGATIFLIRRHHQRVGGSPYFRPRKLTRNAISASLQDLIQGLQFTRRSKLLRVSTITLFFMVVAFYILSYSVNKIYTESFPDAESLARFIGLLTAATSLVALSLQFFVTNRLFRRFGVKKMNLVFPAGVLAAFLTLMVSFSFPAALFGSFVREVVLPAIRRPTRNLMLSALPDYMQGRARAVGISLVLPLSLAIASIVLVSFRGSENIVYFLIIGLIASVGYLGFAIRMNAVYVKEMVQKLKDRLFVPDKGLASILNEGSEELVAELKRGVDHPDEEIALAHARLLIESKADDAATIAIKRMDRASSKCIDQLIGMLRPLHESALLEYCRSRIDRVDDNHLQASMLTILVEARDPIVVKRLPALLASKNPRLLVTGIYAAFTFDGHGLRDTADKLWRDMIRSNQSDRNIPAVELLTLVPRPDYFQDLLARLSTTDVRQEYTALKTLAGWPEEERPEAQPVLETLRQSSDPEIRECCVRCFRLLPETVRDDLYLRSVEDSHPRVREAALEELDDSSQGFTEMLSGWLLGNAGSPRAQKAVLTYLAYGQVSKSVFWEIVNAKAEDAESIADAQAQFAKLMGRGSTKDKYRMLNFVLGERRRQALELTLMALERVEDPEHMSVIRAGIQSKDRRQIANAIEALGDIRDKGLAARLGCLLESTTTTSSAPEGKERFKSVEEILDWCSRRPDPWLREIVYHIRSNLTHISPARG